MADQFISRLAGRCSEQHIAAKGKQGSLPSQQETSGAAQAYFTVEMAAMPPA